MENTKLAALLENKASVYVLQTHKTARTISVRIFVISDNTPTDIEHMGYGLRKSDTKHGGIVIPNDPRGTLWSAKNAIADALERTVEQVNNIFYWL